MLAVRGQAVRGRVGAHAAQRVGLGLAATLGHRLGEVREQDREPQPERERDEEAELLAAARRGADRVDGGDDAADLDHEHDRVAVERARVELDERID